MKCLRNLALLLLAAVFPFAASAQNTTVTGNLRSIFGSTSIATKGRVRYTLTNYKGVPYTSAGPIAEVYKEVTPAADGSYSVTITDNAYIQPQNTYYLVEFYSNGVFQSSTNCTITGATYNQNSFSNCTVLSPGKALLTALPFPTLTALGGVRAADCAPNVISKINTDGTIGCGAVTTATPTSTVAGLSSLSSTEGNIANVTDGQRGFYDYKNAMWRPISADINILDFGARGDGGWYGYVGCTSGSGVISNVGATVGRLPKVGDTFVAAGCGIAGADLQCTLSAASGTAFGNVTCGGGVTAAATLSNRGGRWGTSVDDTAAFSAALTYCSTAAATGGCKIRVPAGIFFVSNVTFPAQSGTQIGQIILEGVGRNASWIVGIGADQTAIFTAPASSVPTAVHFIGFHSYDLNNKKQIMMSWLGGSYHDFSDNDVYDFYDGLRAYNTWENSIQRNRFYGGVNAIHFGPGGFGPVNSTTVAGNYIDAGFSGIGIWNETTGSGGSQSNNYVNNTIQNDNPPFIAAVDLNDNRSYFSGGYDELTVGGATSGYNYIFRGTNNEIHTSRLTPCTQMVGGSNVIYVSSVQFNCSGQSYVFKNDGNYNTYIGYVAQANLSALNSATIIGGSLGSIGASFKSGGISSYPYLIGGAQDWPSGRVDIAGITFGRSPTNALNPSAPVQGPSLGAFGTSAIIPYGSLIANSSYSGSSSNVQGNNVFWVCVNGSNCGTNPIVVADWVRLGDTYKKIHQEGTAAPVSGAWTVGDTLWNTNTATNFYTGWFNIAAGTPGTWVPNKLTVTGTATGCATAATAGATCTTTVTWDTAFADTSYRAVCGGNLITSGIPTNGGVTALTSSTVTFQTVAATAAAAQFTNIQCAAWHN